ncbi:MAG TPA: ABC transporter permease [Syntrophorhabdaceae bacterium]|nr:ABC transporter permease [Syntrophorhabdaceae bacterium]
MKTMYKEILAVCFLLAFWYALSLLVNSNVIPPPHTVFRNFLNEDPLLFIKHFTASFMRILSALLLSIAFGVPAGILIGRSRLLDKLTSSVIYIVYPVPKIVFLPIVIILLGLGNSSKIFIIFFIVFFQILVTTKDAAKSIGDEEILSVRSLGGSTMDVFRHVIIPAILPGIFTSARIAIGTCVAVLFFVESFATEEGLGYLIIDSWSKFDYILMYNAIIAMGTLGLILYMAVDRLQKYLCPWMD